nr:hypothetical protein [Parachlamydiaceae bacterium]
MNEITPKSLSPKEMQIEGILKSDTYKLLGKKVNLHHISYALLENNCFVKLVALGNIKGCPLTTINVISYDRRVFAKTIKYCLKYDPESAEEYLQFAQATVNSMIDCLVKAEYYLLIAEALSKSKPECALDSALKGFNILCANKKTNNSILNLKAIKILSNLIPLNACTVEKLFSKDDPLKISAFYSIYKTWGEKENCRK